MRLLEQVSRNLDSPCHTGTTFISPGYGRERMQNCMYGNNWPGRRWGCALWLGHYLLLSPSLCPVSAVTYHWTRWFLTKEENEKVDQQGKWHWDLFLCGKKKIVFRIYCAVPSWVWSLTLPVAHRRCFYVWPTIYGSRHILLTLPPTQERNQSPFLISLC